jgi:hypothetical protein
MAGGWSSASRAPASNWWKKPFAPLDAKECETLVALLGKLR